MAKGYLVVGCVGLVVGLVVTGTPSSSGEPLAPGESIALHQLAFDLPSGVLLDCSTLQNLTKELCLEGRSMVSSSTADPDVDPNTFHEVTRHEDGSSTAKCGAFDRSQDGGSACRIQFDDSQYITGLHLYYCDSACASEPGVGKTSGILHNYPDGAVRDYHWWQGFKDGKLIFKQDLWGNDLCRGSNVDGAFYGIGSSGALTADLTCTSDVGGSWGIGVTFESHDPVSWEVD